MWNQWLKRDLRLKNDSTEVEDVPIRTTIGPAAAVVA